MIQIEKEDIYIDWMANKVCENEDQKWAYSKLFRRLYLWEFTWIVDHDEYRAVDGLEMRGAFVEETGVVLERGPCMVLEMMVALADRIENGIMGEEEYGDRTHTWFWYMVNSLGLSGYTDDAFDEEIVDEIIQCWLNREFCQDGLGSLFYICGAERDYRRVEIWYQMHAFLNQFVMAMEE